MKSTKLFGTMLRHSPSITKSLRSALGTHAFIIFHLDSLYIL